MYDENDGTMRKKNPDVEVRRTWNDDGKPKFLSKDHSFPLVNFTDENGEKKPIYREEE